MNTLIAKFSDQADEYADNKIQMRGEYHPDWHQIRDTKFAELIVQECAEVAGCNNHVSGFALGDLIQEHFKVKYAE
jgi:hypothetical protein